MKSRKKSIIILSLVVVSLLVPINIMSKEAEDGGAREFGKAKLSKIYNPKNYESEFEPGQVIVELKAEAPDDEISKKAVAANEFLGVEVNKVENFTMDVKSKSAKADTAASIKTISEDNEFVLTLDDDSRQGVLDAISVLKENPQVKYVQPNYVYHIEQAPNDPRYSELWGMEKIYTPNAWDLERGSEDVKVGVIDTGIAYNHVDLTENVHEEWGYNAYENNFSNIMDVNSHGTHVAGTIGADGNNSIGVAGVNWDAYIVPIKISDDASPVGASNSITLKRALAYSENMGLDIVNISYSYFDGGQYDVIVEEGLNYFDGLVVGSAGNSNSNYNNTYNCSNLMLVGNSTSGDAKASSSSHGGAVDVFAPGTDILSTVPGNQYAVKSGTSMAAPHVTGAAALIKSHYPDLTAEEIKRRIVGNAEYVPQLNNLSSSDGRLNVYEALLFPRQRSGDFTYEITSSDTATIIKYYGNAPILEFPSTIDGYRVTAIGEMFVSGRTLSINPSIHERVVIPDSVEKINSFTFAGCLNLQSIKMSRNLKTIKYAAFSGCRNLQEINLPEGLLTIEQTAFDRCSSLKEVHLPNSVTTVGILAFEECSSLEEVHLPINITNISPAVFRHCSSLRTIEIPQGVTSIDAQAFENCTNLENIIFLGSQPPTVSSTTFDGCRNLSTIYVPSASVTSYRSVPQLAPYVVKAIESDFQFSVSGNNAIIRRYNGTERTVLFPSMIGGYPVTEIGSNTLPNNDGVMGNPQTVTRIIIPDSVVILNARAFIGCSSLVSVRLSENIPFIPYEGFSMCSSLSDINFPNGLNNIRLGGFSGCTSLREIRLPDNITQIDPYAFANCTGLVNVQLPANITTICGSSFAGCTGLTEMVIPSRVSMVEAYVFEGCTNLRSVTFLNPYPPSYITTIFDGCTNLTTLYVPSGARQRYQNVAIFAPYTIIEQ